MYPRPRLLRTEPASGFPALTPSGKPPDDAPKPAGGAPPPARRPVSEWIDRLLRRVARAQRAPSQTAPKPAADRSALDEFASEAAVPASAPAATTRRWALPPAVFLVAGVVAVVSAVGFELIRIGMAPARAIDWARGLIQPTATLVVESRPAGAYLLIDGALQGTTPATVSLAPGGHVVVVRRGADERAVPVTLKAGAQLSQYFDMNPASAVAPRRGRISIATDPTGVRVSVDGQARGVSPVTVLDLEEGPHSVTVASENGSAERSVALEAGTTASVVFSLPKMSASVGGWLAVDAPFEVQVLERDDVIGAPGTTKIMVPAGRHELTLVSKTLGYRESRKV